MIESLFGALHAGLSLWDTKEARKYQDRAIKLEKRYYEENKKEFPDHAILDDIEHELCLLQRDFSTGVKRSQAQDKQG